ncbi:MAG: hypothetical protein COA78_33475 [Blastopirellula sp.]|nr:MAG: hypothetical protein COA78_33475 [Blastopirellula sp.]
MEFNRNQYFMLGLIILALGIQFRMIESVILTEEASKFVAQKVLKQKVEKGDIPQVMVPAVEASPAATKKQMITPPKWMGWALISFGSVLILHSLAMKKPD